MADCNWLAGGRWFEDLCVSVRYCQGTYDKDKQEELEDFFYNLPTHDKVQNDMILEMRIACGLEVKDYE